MPGLSPFQHAQILPIPPGTAHGQAPSISHAFDKGEHCTTISAPVGPQDASSDPFKSHTAQLSEVAQNHSQAGLWFLVCDFGGAVHVTFLSLGIPMYKAMLCNHQTA